MPESPNPGAGGSYRYNPETDRVELVDFTFDPYSPPHPGASNGDLIMPITSNNIRLKHQLFTSNGTWTVPAGVNVIWVDCVGGGDGGAGGYASDTSGGGGGGGVGSIGFVQYRFPVVPGETLSIAIGAGGAGGAVGARGGMGGITSVLGSLHGLATLTSSSSGPGPGPGTVNAGGIGGSLAGAYEPDYTGGYKRNTLRPGGAGGAPGLHGDYGYCGQFNGAPETLSQPGAAVGQLGGGGGGGCNVYGIGGAGGNGGEPGVNAPTTYNGLPSYGGGGGGGGCNAAGGNGAPGFVRIYWEG